MDVNFCPERVGLESWQLLSDDLDIWIILTSHDSSQNVCLVQWVVTITPEYSSLQESLVAWPPGMLTAVENTIPCGINYMYVTMDTILPTALLLEINQRVTEVSFGSVIFFCLPLKCLTATLDS